MLVFNGNPRLVNRLWSVLILTNSDNWRLFRRKWRLLYHHAFVPIVGRIWPVEQKLITTKSDILITDLKEDG